MAKLRKQNEKELERLLRKTLIELSQNQIGLSNKETKKSNNLIPQRKLIARIKTTLKEKRILSSIKIKKVKN